VTPFQANVPAVLDRVAVLPGSYLFADSSDAVVVPGTQVAQALNRGSRAAADSAAGRV
jgi:regulator of RNase E activity RraA